MQIGETLRAIRTLCRNMLEEGASFIAIRRFDVLPDGRTMWTQRLALRGEKAVTYVDGCRAGFEPTLEPGMKRIAERMAEARMRER
jgi:hypothetical protein